MLQARTLRLRVVIDCATNSDRPAAVSEEVLEVFREKPNLFSVGIVKSSSFGIAMLARHTCSMH
jgi:hypothetical protein